MKTPEEMAAWFKSRPAKKRENPYWVFDEDAKVIFPKTAGDRKSFDGWLEETAPTLKKIREFFRRFYESFHTEAQVLCVTREDGVKLNEIGVPVLCDGIIGPYEVKVMVLPQDNHMGTSVISESFWQERIINAGIVPVLRIHSHHILSPYQSGTDYSTLNSGTLEMVLGHIFEDALRLCYWLDVPGTDIKAQTFVAEENPFGRFMWIPKVFHSQEEKITPLLNGLPEITAKAVREENTTE